MCVYVAGVIGGGRPQTCTRCLPKLPHTLFFWDIDSQWIWSLSICQDWLISKPQGPALSLPPLSWNYRQCSQAKHVFLTWMLGMKARKSIHQIISPVPKLCFLLLFKFWILVCVRGWGQGSYMYVGECMCLCIFLHKSEQDIGILLYHSLTYPNEIGSFA